MEVIEIKGKIDEEGKLIIDEELPIRNKQVRVMLLIEEDDIENRP